MTKQEMIVLIGEESTDGMRAHEAVRCDGYRAYKNWQMMEFDIGDGVWTVEKRHAVGWRFGEGTQEVPPSGIAVVAKRLWRIA